MTSCKNISDEHDRFCSTSHAASILGLSIATVQHLANTNRLIAWKTTGGHRRVSLTSILKYKKDNIINSTYKIPSQVLIVEDDLNTRNMYKAYFSNLDLPLDIVIYESALDALVDLHSLTPLILLTDLHMSKMDGFDFINTVRKNLKLSSMPVIAITGMSSDEIHKKGGLNGDVLILNKPINMDWLKDFLLGIMAMQVNKNVI